MFLGSRLLPSSKPAITDWVFLTLIAHSNTLFCLLSFIKTFVIIVGLHWYPRIIFPLEGQMISKLNSIHNFHSPCCVTYHIHRLGIGTCTSVVGTGEGGYIILATLAIIHWVLEFKSNFFLSPHWFPLCSSKNYLATHSKYQESNGIENWNILRIRNLSDFVSNDSIEWSGVDIIKIYVGWEVNGKGKNGKHGHNRKTRR